MISKKTQFLGYRRENGRVGVRNHVIILPVDDISNAACEAVANNIKGTMALPHPYGRLQFGADLELHFRTLIGTGCQPERGRGGGDRHRGGLDQEGRRRHRRHRQAGDRLPHRTARRSRDHHARVARPRASTCSGPPRSSASRARSTELWVSTKCGESDTTSGCGANPTVGNAFDKLYELGSHAVLRRDHRADRRRDTWWPRAAARREVREQFMAMFNHYQDMIDRHKTSTCRTRSRPRATSPAA